jgi:tRNA isopentenyl-2-thiomethyl-A-37 hydroxylase MiaE
MRIARGDYYLTTPEKLKVKIPAVLEKTTPEEWEITALNGDKRRIMTQEISIRAAKVVGESIYDYCGMVKVFESRVHLYKESLRPFWLSTNVITEATIR